MGMVDQPLFTIYYIADPRNFEITGNVESGIVLK